MFEGMRHSSCCDFREFIHIFRFPSVTSSNKSTIETQVRPMSQAPVNEKRRNYRFYAGDPYVLSDENTYFIFASI